jgi:hypothetical protein
VIAEYLSELACRLPETRRRRLLREAEAHLRDAAASYEARGLNPGAAEAAAVRDFGPVAVVARAFAAEAAVHATRRAALLAVAALASLVLPLYGIPENTLPPAPWVEKPGHLAVQQSVALSLFALALTSAVAAAGAAFSRRSRLAAPLLALAAALGAATMVVATALAIQWDRAAPETPLLGLLALLLPFAAAPVAVALGAAAWAGERRALLG